MCVKYLAVAGDTDTCLHRYKHYERKIKTSWKGCMEDINL